MTVDVLPGSEEEAAVWATALHVSEVLGDLPWVLVGAQMVMLLEREAGRTSGRTTGDVDAMVDVRAVAGATRIATARLLAAGFEPEGRDHPYRFRRGAEQVDILAPDHLGRRADLTTAPPGTTAAIPGGTRALATRRVLDVRVVGGPAGLLPVPSLAGGIVLKLRAWEARQAERDAEDLVRLLSLVVDVEAARSELKPAERRLLGQVRPLADERSRIWRAAADPEEARAALLRLVDARRGAS
jgi:predicted nucleotidyltransferase